MELTGGLKPSLSVGVLGGLGPAATLDLYARVVALTPATRDQEHLHVIIDSDPRVPNRNEAVAGTGPSPGPALAAMARRLEIAGADFLVMACNTAHAFQADIEAAVSVPFVSLIDETVRATVERCPSVQRVGVLAASGCLQAGLYRTAFGRLGVSTLEPSGEALERFMTALYGVKAGSLEAARAPMLKVADDLVAAGAEVLVAGCTEVPLVLAAADLAVPLINSTEALARAVVRRALGPAAVNATL